MRKSILSIVTVAACILSLSISSSMAESNFPNNNITKNLHITHITPSGEDIAAENQLVFQFNRPVVPLGRMQRQPKEIPIDISPRLRCQWRWLNNSALACNLNDGDSLKPATRYTVTVNPGIHAEDGATLAAPYNHIFLTQRPQVRWTDFHHWQGPSTPVIRVQFNQPVTQLSVEKHITFISKDAATNSDIIHDINVEKLPDKANENKGSNIIELARTTAASDRGPDIQSNLPASENITEDAQRQWLVSPRQPLPLGRKVGLKVSRGLVSAVGEQRGIEDRIAVTFNTFPEFAFLGVTCSTNAGKRILITPQNNTEIGRCDALSGVAVSFSAPVVRSQIRKHLQITPSFGSGKKDYNPWENMRDYSRLKRSHKQGQHYDVWLPKTLKSAQKYTLNSMPFKLQDEFGRQLTTPIDLSFFTDHRPPNFELVHKTAVLEKHVDSEVPLYVTNLDAVIFNYDKLTTSGVAKRHSLRIDDIAEVADLQFAIPLPVRDMLGGESGVIYGTLDSEPKVDKNTYQRTLFASVSPYQLHVKIGHYNTLVWVTDFISGEPVSDAKVRLYKGTIGDLTADFKTLHQSTTDQSGLAVLQGSLAFDPKLKLFQWCYQEDKDKCQRWFMRIDKGDEMALMPLDNRFEVDPYYASGGAFWKRSKRQYGHIHAWGTTAQGVYRGGDTINYKFYVRDQDNDGYIAAPAADYQLQIVDPTGKTVHEINNIALSEFGGYSGAFTIAKNATVGWYNFSLTSNYTDDYRWQPMQMLVSDFTPAAFKVDAILNGDLFQSQQEVDIYTHARLHSGGAYSDAEVRVTAHLDAAHFVSQHPLANDFNFDSYTERDSTVVFQKIDNLNDNGMAKHKFVMPKTDIIYGYLRVESAVRDDRGNYISAHSNANYNARTRLVGLKRNQWLFQQGKTAKIQYIVVDAHGKPAANTTVNLKIERLHTRTARVKGAGNAYLTTYIDEWILSGVCQGLSELQPKTCNFMPATAGKYRITATITDTKGDAHSTQMMAWVSGKNRVIWHMPENDSLQIIAEKSTYNIGDKAQYLLKNPYPGAMALISIERYGVIKSWVQKLHSSTPKIEFEIEKDFMPGFYLSVVVVSPRVMAPPPQIGQIDLGKPAFKIGYVEVSVQDPYKQIDVSVQSDAKIYRAGDKVKVALHAEPKHKDKDENIEFAVVVLDEAVLDLLHDGRDYFDPYAGFYKLDGLDLWNYNSLTRLIGRQAFASKGANPGGDGGADINIRSVFKHVSYWNPSIKADKNGDANISFTVPDNLTGWHILAFAVTPSDRMGLGSNSFKVNRPTEIRAVMPNQITEGDVFQAGFNIINRTNKSRNINVNIAIDGAIQSANKFSTKIHLAPYQRHTLYMPVVSSNVPQGHSSDNHKLHFIVKATDTIDSDAIEHNLPIYKRRAFFNAANFGTIEATKVFETIHFPDKIHGDAGDLSVTLAPTIIGNIDGAVRYVRDYPYDCWEQKLTTAVMAAHYQDLKNYFSAHLQWQESQKLPDEILQQAVNYQAANGGMAYFMPLDSQVSPYLSAYTALAFNWLRASGYTIPQSVESELHGYLEHFLKANTAPSFYSQGMLSTVRAIALAALSVHGKVSVNDLERYRSSVASMSLFGKAHYLQAALKVQGSNEIVKEVTDIILAYSNQTATAVHFNEDLDGDYARILATPQRTNCAILSAFIGYHSTAFGAWNWAGLFDHIPFKLMQGIMQNRKNSNHWHNTQENIFCMNSLVNYAYAYENVKPNIQFSVAIDEMPLGKASFTNQRDSAQTFSQPITANDAHAKRIVTIERQGTGRLYYKTRLRYALMQDADYRVNAGINIRKEYSIERHGQWISLDDSPVIKRGDLLRVDIFVSVPTERNFVVVDDSLPGGFEVINRDLATASLIDANKSNFQVGDESSIAYQNWQNSTPFSWNFYHREIKHKAVHYYADYLPAGRYHLSYTVRAIAVGQFFHMPVHAEEMYNPDVFGKGLGGVVTIEE